MQGQEGLSNFRSAIEWPDMRPPREEATGDLKPLSAFIPDVLDNLAAAVTLAPECESPIEIELGARLTVAISLIKDPRLKLIPQYVLGSYRYDFAITRDERLLALIECDGRDFHCTEDQLANDRAKDNLATQNGVYLFRLSGSQIFVDGKKCARRILTETFLKSDLSPAQWSALEIALAPRPSARDDFL